MITHKFCPGCKEIKSVELFYKNKGKGREDEYQSYCKVCSNEHKKARRPMWNEARNRLYQIDRLYRQSKNRKNNLHVLQVKMEVFAHYCGGEDIRCLCPCNCGVTDISCLTIAHINNDGAQHRKEIGKGRILRWLKKNNFPSGFSVYCFNCNTGAYVNGGVCPRLVKEYVNDLATIHMQQKEG